MKVETKTMTLYHASAQLYANGQVIDALLFNPSTYYYQKQQRAGKSWIDDFLDNNERPIHYPMRRLCCFASDSSAICVAFLNAEEVSNIKLYEVSMRDPVAAGPMWLVGELIYHKGNPPNAIAKEYWNPTRAWKILEYLSTEMTILRQVDLPDTTMIAGAKFQYGADRDESLGLFPRPAAPSNMNAGPQP